ncbi:MAG: T9SS type A sorting domain-containing protein, partial [Bacteroidota bacterium]|nr:T9SS type A sorting domain-containing protein [Bacteroidota bacterium]
AEGPFLIAAYMSLTGVDGFFWFSASSYKIDSDPYFPWFDVGPNGNQKAMIRWSASIPGQLSLFPANALSFRKGYISQGAPVVHEERELESLWTREVPLITEEAGFDPNRDSWDNTTGTTETVVAPIAFLAGPVEVKYDGNPEKSSISGDLNNLLDFPNKTVTSNTGQLKWNYEKGFCTMNAPSAQGVVGFMESGYTVNLEDVTITSFNEYAAVSIVSMDDNPLKQSEQILVQVGTIYQPTNWRETPVKVTIDDVEKDGFKITNTGKMPWRAENTKISLSLKNMLITSAYALDQNGYIKKEIFVERYADHVKIWLPANTMYMVLNTNDPTVITGMEEETLNSVKLYPNPTKGTVVLEIPEYMKSINLLQVYDNSGRMVYSEKNLKPGQKQITLPKLSNGIYHIVFDSPKNKKTNLRLLIEN